MKTSEGTPTNPILTETVTVAPRESKALSETEEILNNPEAMESLKKAQEYSSLASMSNGKMSSKQFEIRLIGNSSKQYNSLDSNMKCKVNIAIESLSANPLLLGKKLDGKLAGLYSYRVGSYRIIYDVDIESKICNVHGIPHRGKAYKK